MCQTFQLRRGMVNRYNAMVSKIRQLPYRGVQVEVDCTGVHCYDTQTDHVGDEVILTVSAPVSLRDLREYHLCKSA